MQVPTETTSKSDYFRKMYRAHEIIADISERIDKLYASATSISPVNDGMPKSPNPQRFESIIVEIADLRTLGENLLKQRARFDLFICSLTANDANVISMRYEQRNGWKEIAGELGISVTTAKESLQRLENEAEAFGCFRPLPATIG